MRAILFVLFLFTISSMFGQIPYDTIWAVNGQPIICTIVKAKKNNVTYFAMNEIPAKMLPMPQIDRFTKLDYNNHDFSVVVEVEATKDDLFNRARLWFAEAFKDSRKVLELEDRESGILRATGWTSCNTNTEIEFWFTVTVKFKDGRYKMELSNMSWSENKYPLSMYNERFAAQYLRDLRLVLDGFHAAMQVSDDGEEDW